MSNAKSGTDHFLLRQVLLGNGMKVHFAERGERAKIPIIFLHGYIDSWRSFFGVLSELPGEYHLLAIDLRGHGESAKPECCYTMKDFTDDVAFLMNALGLKKASLVGHSMGSFIAQSFAATYPDRTERLVLVSSAPSVADNATLLEIKPHVDALQDPIDRGFVAEFQAPSNPIPRDVMEMIVSESMKVPARVWRAALAGLLEVDHRPILKTITAPTLLVWGNQDGIFTRKDQEELLSEIPDSALREYDAGHALHWEKPKELAVDLERFLDKDT